DDAGSCPASRCARHRCLLYFQKLHGLLCRRVALHGEGYATNGPADLRKDPATRASCPGSFTVSADESGARADPFRDWAHVPLTFHFTPDLVCVAEGVVGFFTKSHGRC